jgi:crossover junction endodeoxyribonuclease RuvC
VSSEPRIILGLDPGIALLGYGLIRTDGDAMQHVEHGCITTSPGQPLPARLRALNDGLLEIKRRFHVTDVAVETLFYSRNVSTAVAVGQARGVALLATVDSETNYGEYAPSEIKQIVGGFGAARKREMQEMVALLLGLDQPPSPDDAADALAVAICHARRSHLSSLLAASAASQAR